MSKNLPAPSADDLHRWTTTPEGQFFERKSAVEGAHGRKRSRNVRDIAWDVVETLAAMANADGGDLAVGLENGGALTGVLVAEDRLPVILTAGQNRNYVNPPLPVRARELRTADGHRLLHFTVDWSPNVHQLADSRYLLRVKDQNAPFPAEQIAALKAAKTQGLWERSFPPGATMTDLDEALLASIAPPAWGARKPIEILQDRGLVVDRGGELIPTLAHRDYGIQGGGIEIGMFDDRLEVRSPGLPPAPVTVEALSRREHLHVSRNPLLVRVLVELGFMRELGEGIPRMFDEMVRAGCRPPALALVGGMSFQVTLRHEPVYDQATLSWLKQFGALALNMDQKRILAAAHAHEDRFTSRDVQSLLETDIYGASARIKDLLRKGAARSAGKGSRIYHVQEPLKVRADTPEELARMLPVLNRRGNLRNGDLRKELRVARNTAFRLLQEWTEAGWLVVPKGKRGRGAIYTAGPKLLHQSPIAPSAPQAGAMPGETGAMPGETRNEGK